MLLKSKNNFNHGGDILTFCKTYKFKQKDIIDLSSNINFIKPKLKTNLSKLNISNYPSYDKLYEIIAEKYSVKADEIELFNGGSSAIFSLYKSLNLKHCSIYSPAYLEYKKASITFDYKLSLINRFDKKNKKIKKNSLVIFVNPSTPDGRYYKLEKLIKTWIAKNCTILVDESFLEFTKQKSISPLINSYKKLYVLKSMTKIYSCAGVRLGVLISNKENIKALKQKEPLWKISHFDSIFLQDVLKEKNFVNKSKEKTNEAKRYTLKNLKKFKFIKKVFKSEANFLLLKLKKIDSLTFQKKLAKHKIMIRDCSNFDFLDNSFVRIAIKDKKSMKAFIEALNKEFN